MRTLQCFREDTRSWRCLKGLWRRGGGTEGGVQRGCSSLTNLGSASWALKGKYKMFKDVYEELGYVAVDGRQLSSRRMGWGMTSEMGNPR